jgi:hypothetical protein
MTALDLSLGGGQGDHPDEVDRSGYVCPDTGGPREATLAAMTGMEGWTVERANAALPRVGAALVRIRELVAEARREREETAGLREGNGHPAAPRGTDELRAEVEALTAEGIVLRDLDAGLVDFPARLEDGRQYLLCWVLGEPAVEWWHWPDTGFAGRRPLSDPPA